MEKYKKVIQKNEFKISAAMWNDKFELPDVVCDHIVCDYSDAYILVSGTITTDQAVADDNAKRLDERSK